MVAVLSIVFADGKIKSPDTDLQESNYLDAAFEDMAADSDDITINATYMDRAETFEELESTAGFIVRATVESVETRTAGQVATLAVSEVFKGNVQQSCLLYQMSGDDNVEIGKEYILFMNEQTGDAAQNDYYPVAGGRGVVLVYSSATVLELDSEKLNSQALTNRINENLTSRNRTSTTYTITTRE